MNSATRIPILEISPNILRIDAPLGDRSMALHALVGERVWLIDTGVANTPEQYLLPALQSCGITPKQIAGAVITHCDADHCGGNGELCRLVPHVMLIAHRADAPLIANPQLCIEKRYNFEPAYGVLLPGATRARLIAQLGRPKRIDIVVDGETVELDIGVGRRLLVRHAPGHTAGHLIVHDPETRTVVLTDAVLGRYMPDRQGRPLFAPTYRIHRAYLETIEMIRDLQPELLLPTHFSPIRGRQAVEQFLDESRAQAEAIITRVRTKMTPGATLGKLALDIGEGLADWVDPQSEFFRFSLYYPVAAAIEELKSTTFRHE